MAPFTIFPDIDQPAITENFHVMGKRRLCNIKSLENHTGTLFTAGKHLHDLKSVRISECLANGGNLIFCHNNT